MTTQERERELAKIRLVYLEGDKELQRIRDRHAEGQAMLAKIRHDWDRDQKLARVQYYQG